MNDIALVYMVAGLSKRFGGKVKQFANVGPQNETLIEYSLNQALPAGFTKIVFVVGEKTEKLFLEKFGYNYRGIPISYAFQGFDPQLRDRPWGVIDALCCAKEKLDCPFVACNGDDIYGEEVFTILVNHLKNKKNPATIGYKLGRVMPEKGSVNRGIFSLNTDNTIKSINEFLGISRSTLDTRGLTEENLCSMNIFAFLPEDLILLNESLENFKLQNQNERLKECLLSDEIGKLIEQQKMIVDLYPTDSQWLGVTNPEDEEIVRAMLKENNF